MAKKSVKSDRQAVIDEIRKKQKGADRRRGFAIIGVCGLIAVVILGARDLPDHQAQPGSCASSTDLKLAEIGARRLGVPEGHHQAGHRQLGPRPDERSRSTTPTPRRPSARTGTSAGVAPAPFERKFYTADDRPELESLVHNLEHGYTILWYDETAADDGDMLSTIEGIADKFTRRRRQLRLKFIAAPWTSEDGKAFPDGQHIAFSHWSAGGNGETDTSKQEGVWQYCSEPSGAALEQVHERLPLHRLPRARRAVA